MKRVWLFGLLVLVCGIGFSAAADDEVPPVKVTTMLPGLDNPYGVAVQPGTGNLFISESGAGRIIRITPAGHGVVVSGFPQKMVGSGPHHEGGPLVLAFVGRNLLVVGGGLPSDKEVIGIYDVSSPTATLKAEQMKFHVGPWLPGLTSKGDEEHLLAVTSDGGDNLYFTSQGDDSKGWISRVELSDGRPGSILPLVPTKDASRVDGPAAIVLSPRGEIVVGLMGKPDKPHDSVLAFFDPQSKKMLLKLETGLNDITGLAYSPRTGWLYAIDSSWSAPKEGGLFRLDKTLVDGRQGVKAVRVATLDKPTALAFAPNGALYVTLFGTATAGAKDKPGSLVRITGKM